VHLFLFLQEEKTIGNGGDLMADLHAKLSMRRKVWIVSLCMEFIFTEIWCYSHVNSAVVLKSPYPFVFFWI
jgi:hypothetical protein